MRFGILQFPGTWSDTDCHHAVSAVLGQEADYIWHKDTSLEGLDCVILPGGFSYGDYLRPGAMARLSPVMDALYAFAESGGTVIGICNGFQILCESGLLPGALRANRQLEYRCQWTNLSVERSDTRFSSTCKAGQVLQVPISHGEGNYYADAETLDMLEREANPNGSARNIAGVINEAGNVLGMMPHPERCCEALLGGTDGALIFQSIVDSVSRT
ncbi:Phosphoribosylformylglycinamidine synthase subunit PurQ [Geodia barretti]|uniref:Phosphoribosylformylglycinamidine synthase subunit PurQ n=1 Tax=Geodia barretti TaxID=519541 RepID=A0AA35TK95_GEOBA|nr:Phosphoribosylformylglycinamidine synthase subunit PurQ [Geodia barretti]